MSIDMIEATYGGCHERNEISRRVAEKDISHNFMKKLGTTWDEWHRRHRRFPSVAYCVEALKRRNTRGELVETICRVLELNAEEHAGELLAAVDDQDNLPVRLQLLGVIENAALNAAVPLWSRLLAGTDTHERIYAIRALNKIDTKETRRVLWQAGEATGRVE